MKRVFVQHKMETSPFSTEQRSRRRLSAMTRSSSRSMSPRGNGNDTSALASDQKSEPNSVKSAEDQNDMAHNANADRNLNKRRMGALIGWETRRQNSMKKGASYKAKAERQIGPQVPTVADRSLSGERETESKERRRMGALAGWQTRRQNEMKRRSGGKVERASIESKENLHSGIDESYSTAREDESKERRRVGAMAGWETRRKNAMKKVAAYKSDESVEQASFHSEENFDSSTAETSAQALEAESKERRRVGALAGWETRRQNAMKRSTVSNNSKDERVKHISQVASAKANTTSSNNKSPTLLSRHRATEEKKKRSRASLIGWETRRENARKKTEAAQHIVIGPSSHISTGKNYPNNGDHSSSVPPKLRASKTKEKRRTASLIGWEKRRENARKRAAASAEGSAKDLEQRAAALKGSHIMSTESVTCSKSALISVTPHKNNGGMIDSNKRGRYEVDECDTEMSVQSQNRNSYEPASTNILETNSSHSSAYDNPEADSKPGNLMTTLQQDDNDSSEHLRDLKLVSKTATYNADARRQAALAGWEKRRLAKLRKQTKRASSASSLNDIPSEHIKVAKKRKKEKASSQDFSTIDGIRAGRSSLSRSKTSGTMQQRRSTRASTRSSQEVNEPKGDIRAIATYLRVSRHWMEFHPSSRYGNGTATYAFIPASIAVFIRNGTIPQKHIVLKHGTIGVHFALDYEGIGGLRAMVEKYGEDYAPYPTDEMLECAKNEQDKRLLRVSEWDLGEDMPWEAVGERIVEEVREKMRHKLDKVKSDHKSEENSHNSNSRFGAIVIKELTTQPLSERISSIECSDDLQSVGEILASLDASDSNLDSAPSEFDDEAGKLDAKSSCTILPGSLLQVNPHTTEEIASISTPVKALENMTTSHAFQSNRVDKKSEPNDDRVGIPKESKSVIFVPSPRLAVFKQWHFGLA